MKQHSSDSQRKLNFCALCVSTARSVHLNMAPVICDG